MSKVEFVESQPREYQPIKIILETREEFLDVLKALNRGGGRLFDIWEQMRDIAQDEGVYSIYKSKEVK